VLVITTCSQYVTKGPTNNCSSKWPAATPTAATARAAKASTPTVAGVNRQIAAGRSPFLARQEAVANGLDPAALLAAGASTASKKNAKNGAPAGTTAQPKIDLPATLLPGLPSSGGGSSSTAPAGASPPGATSSTATPASSSTPGSSSSGSASPGGGATTTLLDYLLGG
jgi:hypothetical protein